MSLFKIDPIRTSLHNPLPKITRGEVSAMLGVRERNPNHPEFVIECVYDSNVDRVLLQPDETREIPDEFARMFARIYGYTGIVLLREDRDLTEQLLDGLDRAATHYREFGAEMLAEVRMNMDEQQFHRMRSNFLGSLRNEIREELVRKEMERLQSGTRAKPEVSNASDEKAVGGRKG